MKQLIHKCKITTYLFVLLCAIASNHAIAAEQTTAAVNQANQAEVSQTNQQNLNKMIMDTKPVTVEPKTDQEAIAAANQLNAISESIKANQESILSGNLINSINTTVISKLKATIQVIEIQRKKLVDMIMNEPATSTPDSQKMDSIVDSLEAERTSLANLIFGEIDSAAAQQKTVNDIPQVKTSGNQFSVFK